MKHILLCGGAGTRLWPLSHSGEPKQLIRLFNGSSLLQLNFILNRKNCDSFLAVSNIGYKVAVDAQLAELTDATIEVIPEAVPRNTAPAIALAALAADADEVLIVTPTDHLIEDGPEYHAVIAKAKELAEQGNIVTIGLKPTYPETGYGYIQHNGNDVIRFAEKPDVATAEQFLASGDYLWNSGIFCFKASVILEELERYTPEVLEKSRVAYQEWRATGAITEETMMAIPSISIDYAVMERSQKMKVVPTNMLWSDLGSYESLVKALLETRSYINPDALYVKCDDSNNFVFGAGKPVALIGVEDLIVVDRPNGILIMKKGMGQDVKTVHKNIVDKYPSLA